jgi:hypothetical protein
LIFKKTTFLSSLKENVNFQIAFGSSAFFFFFFFFFGGTQGFTLARQAHLSHTSNPVHTSQEQRPLILGFLPSLVARMTGVFHMPNCFSLRWGSLKLFFFLMPVLASNCNPPDFNLSSD